MRNVRDKCDPRLNVMLSDFDEPWAAQLPRLLEPQGIHAIRVHDVNEAMRLVADQAVHVAVVELTLPGGVNDVEQSGGLKLLKVIRRLEPTPPTIVVRGLRFEQRADDRILAEALKLDAFSVLDQPVELEQMLDMLRRIIQRYYGGAWPQPES